MSDTLFITPDSIVSQSKGQVSTEIDGEIVLMDIEKGSYYGMNPILSHIWKLIEKPTAVSALCAQLMEEYDVSREECQKDVLESLEQLKRENQIGISDD